MSKESLLKTLGDAKHKNPVHPRGVGYNEGIDCAVALVHEHLPQYDGRVLKYDDFIRFIYHANGDLGDFTCINQYAADRLYKMLNTYLSATPAKPGECEGV